MTPDTYTAMIKAFHQHTEPPMFHFGIRVKVIFGVVIIMVMIMTGMTFVLIEKSKEDILFHMEKRGLALISYLERSIQTQPEVREAIITDQSTPFLQQLISLFTSDPELRELLIVGREEIILAHSRSDMVGKAADDQSITLVMQEGKARTTVDESGLETMEILEPIILEGEVVGVIKAVFSLSGVITNVAVSRSSTIKVIFVESVVLIIFISLLLTMMVARPIERLARITNMIASGDLDSRVERVSNDEFGYLASAFNRMTEQLQKSHQALKSHIISLEEAYQALKETQDHLISTEKLASVGRLAAGVAHEIGNPLSSILGYTDILTMADLKETERLDYVTKIQQAIDRIQKIIRELLDFARPSSMELHPVYVHEVLNRTTTLAYHHPAFNNVAISMDVPADLPPVLADEHPLGQVFLNILINGAQAYTGIAMDRPRELRVGTRIKTREHSASGAEGSYLIVGEGVSYRSSPDSYLEITFQDRGAGISPENLSRIFDPFFTTKKIGEGSGLGLTICHTIIERFKGKIRIESEPGQGTTVSIVLSVAEMINPEALENIPAGGGETP